jgi:hypothetical protein
LTFKFNLRRYTKEEGDTAMVAVKTEGGADGDDSVDDSNVSTGEGGADDIQALKVGPHPRHTGT